MKLTGKAQSFLTQTHIGGREKIKEALFIDCLNPQKQISNALMNLEKGLDIPDCWKEFNSDIRKIFFKKVPSTK